MQITLLSELVTPRAGKAGVILGQVAIARSEMTGGLEFE